VKALVNKKIPAALVYGLDIGTRSVVGTVGYRKGKKFIVVALESMEHETRAMLDGQIHDIAAVAETIRQVTAGLEKKIGGKLSRVCIAAAGRVLKTVQVHTDHELDEERTVTQEDIYTLNSVAIEDSYKNFLSESGDDMKFYCVGSSVVRYYLNNSPMNSIIDHKAKSISVDLIGTFLPDDVVDGLYKTVDMAGLEVASLTLEPIAAIGLAIPEKFRLLNIALIDVGAGTSDISITKAGSIIAFGMIPTAGDLLTEHIANHCMVDFNTAEQIKCDCTQKSEAVYEDIFGLPQKVSAKEIADVIAEDVEKMATLAADKIIELNGGKSVGAVFVVGGGGSVPGYTDILADKLGLVKERVALRGREVMNDIVFEEKDVDVSSLLVTPIGIALSFYDENNNFIYVDFNDNRVKIYNNNSLTVMDVAMQADFPADGFFPKSGSSIIYTLNGRERMLRGSIGEPAVITVNGDIANMHTPVKENDIISVKESTAGEPAKIKISELDGIGEKINIIVNDNRISLPKLANVNGRQESGFYEIKNKDKIKILDFYTVSRLREYMDIEPGMHCIVNGRPAGKSTKIYENFIVSFIDDIGEYERPLSKENTKKAADTGEKAKEVIETKAASKENTDENAALKRQSNGIPRSITVTVNGKSVTLTGKSDYVFVDIFDFYEFDLSKPKGNIVTKLNGKKALYMEELHASDIIEIFWEE